MSGAEKPSVAFTLRLTPGQFDRLRLAAFRARRSMADVVRDALTVALTEDREQAGEEQ